MPSELSFRVLNRAHRAIIRLSGGRLGWSAPGYGMPVVELTTTGRRTGEPRTTMLTSPLRQGDELVLVASAGGNDHHPAWYLNLLANPEVTVTTREMRAQRMRAEPVSEAERSRLWPIIVRDHPNYAGYQRKTRREIPLVVLRPRDGPAPSRTPPPTGPDGRVIGQLGSAAGRESPDRTGGSCSATLRPPELTGSSSSSGRCPGQPFTTRPPWTGFDLQALSCSPGELHLHDRRHRGACMTKRRWLAGVALAAVVAGLGIAAPAGAVPVSQLASQPVTVFAVSVDGQHNLYVSWTPPASNGGSPILYFVASTLNGHRRCVVPNPGPNSCVIGRVNGNAHYNVYVRAVTGVGRGRPTIVPNLVIHPGPTTSPAGGGGGGGEAPSPQAAPATPTAAVSPAAAVAATASGTPSAGTATIDPPAQLPFTGVDVQILLLVGSGLLFGGLVLRSSSREWRRIGSWIFGI